MRVSTVKSDPGYHPATCGIEVFLDGRRMEGEAVTADDELGEVVVYKKNEQGGFFTEGDEFVCETLRGKVEIIVPFGFRPASPKPEVQINVTFSAQLAWWFKPATYVVLACQVLTGRKMRIPKWLAVHGIRVFLVRA